MKTKVVSLAMRRRQKEFLRKYGAKHFLVDVGFRVGITLLFGNEAYYTRKECGYENK